MNTFHGRILVQPSGHTLAELYAGAPPSSSCTPSHSASLPKQQDITGTLPFMEHLYKLLDFSKNYLKLKAQKLVQIWS
jgi:hypothetical protein